MGSIPCACSSTIIYNQRSKQSGNLLFRHNAIKSNYIGFIPTSAKCGETKAMASPTVSSPKREKDPKKRIVITGIGLVSVFGTDVDVYYDKLLDGVSGVTPIDKFDTRDYPVKIAGHIHGFSSEGYVDEKTNPRLDDSQSLDPLLIN